MRAFYREVLAFNETASSKLFQESHVYGHIARMVQQDTQAIRPPRLLRPIAANGHVTLAPISAMNSRRLSVFLMLKRDCAIMAIIGFKVFAGVLAR